MPLLPTKCVNFQMEDFVFSEKSPSRVPKMAQGYFIQLWKFLRIAQPAPSWARWSLIVRDWEDCILHTHSSAFSCFIFKSSLWRLRVFYQLLFILYIKLHGAILLMINNNRQRLLVKVQLRNSTFLGMIFLCESFMFGCSCEKGR